MWGRRIRNQKINVVMSRETLALFDNSQVWVVLSTYPSWRNPPPLVKYCQFGVSPVNHSDTESDMGSTGPELSIII